MKLVFIKRQPIVDDLVSFWFKPEQKFSYQAGQYVELTLNHDDPDERGNTRWFTLSSSPSEPLLSITTRHGRTSFKKQLWQMKKGDVLESSEPMGDFVLPKDENRPLVFVIGGVGITPVRSIIKWLADTREQRNIEVLYTVSAGNKFAFIDLLKNYGASLKTFHERLGAEEVLENIKPLGNKLVYLSGPEPMIEALYDNLQSLGVPREQLVMDGFSGYPDSLS